MSVSFQAKALPASRFAHLWTLTDAELRAIGAERQVADAQPGYPCRISLQDAAVGERVILLHFEHHPVAGPYRAAGPIFIREHARETAFGPGEIPGMLLCRPLSLRVYDATGRMLSATVTEGPAIRATLEGCFDDPAVAYVHAHNARPGCFNCAFVRP
jgi:hypothetical protein